MRTLIVFFLFILLVHPSASQHVLLGPKAGIQASKAFFDEAHFYKDFQTKMLVGYHAGVVSNIKVSDLFSLQAEILYNQTGKRLKGKDHYSSHIERYDNLTLPLLLRTSFRQGFNQYYFNVGPNLSYWLGGSGQVKIPELIEPGIVEQPYTIKFGEGIFESNAFYVSDPNRFQLGLDIGVGAMLPIRQQFIMLDLRYTWGHTNMAKPTSSYMNFLFYDGNMQHANHVLAFSVAYLFEFDFLTMRTKGKSTSKGEK